MKEINSAAVQERYELVGRCVQEIKEVLLSNRKSYISVVKKFLKSGKEL